jgi:putative PEP-CTERM system histidine kinase
VGIGAVPRRDNARPVDVTLLAVLPLVAAVLAAVVALAAVVRRSRSIATWLFASGMLAMCADALLTSQAVQALAPDDTVRWLRWSFLAKSTGLVAWLAFSLAYSRGEYKRFLARSRVGLALAAALAVGPVVGFSPQLLDVVRLEEFAGAWVIRIGAPAKLWSGILLVVAVITLANLEQTFRAAVGTMRWRIKYVVLAFAVMLGTQIYVRSQALLFPVYDLGVVNVEAGALIVGCLFLTVAYARTGLAGVDVYPSAAILRSSATIVLAGGYLFAVGVAAQVVRRLGWAEAFEAQTLVFVVGLAGLTVLLASDRVRQRIQSLAARHFGRSQYDSTRVWTRFSHGLARVHTEEALGTAVVGLVADTFNALSVRLWSVDESTGQLTVRATTSQQPDGAHTAASLEASSGVLAGLVSTTGPTNLDAVTSPWSDALRAANPTDFVNGGHRWVVPLRAAEQALGLLVIGDRVGGAAVTEEERALLACIADQVTSSLLNTRLAQDVARARELEAFQTMSAFFVHDLKNAASSLNLTLKNMPVHFDDPAFRADALRALGNTARRLDDVLTRLGALRQRTGAPWAPTDVGAVVGRVLEALTLSPGVEVMQDIQATPRVMADREQLNSVVTNLVVNAGEAVGTTGRIDVHLRHDNGRVVLSVADTGCGMSPEFIRHSLFKPFQSTKKSGLGIGLFHTSSIVQAHGGAVHVDSQPGKGTTFVVTLPVEGRS